VSQDVREESGFTAIVGLAERKVSIDTGNGKSIFLVEY